MERYLFAYVSIGFLLYGYSVGSSNVVLDLQCDVGSDGDPRDTSSALVVRGAVQADELKSV